MKIRHSFLHRYVRNFHVILLLVFLLPRVSDAQQLKITDFALFGGVGACPTGPGLIHSQ